MKLCKYGEWMALKTKGVFNVEFYVMDNLMMMYLL